MIYHHPEAGYFSAAAKIFGIIMEIQKGEPLKVEEGIDKRI